MSQDAAEKKTGRPTSESGVVPKMPSTLRPPSPFRIETPEEYETRIAEEAAKLARKTALESATLELKEQQGRLSELLKPTGDEFERAVQAEKNIGPISPGDIVLRIIWQTKSDELPSLGTSRNRKSYDELVAVCAAIATDNTLLNSIDRPSVIGIPSDRVAVYEARNDSTRIVEGAMYATRVDPHGAGRSRWIEVTDIPCESQEFQNSNLKSENDGIAIQWLIGNEEVERAVKTDEVLASPSMRTELFDAYVKIIRALRNL